MIHDTALDRTKLIVMYTEGPPTLDAAADLDELGVTGQEDDQLPSGEGALVKGGYGLLPRYLARGLDLRTSIPDPEGMTIPLNGPMTATFETESVPVPANGGEIRTVEIPSGSVRISIAGPAEDYNLQFLAIPRGGG